jgi:hypothetical protein
MGPGSYHRPPAGRNPPDRPFVARSPSFARRTSYCMKAAMPLDLRAELARRSIWLNVALAVCLFGTFALLPHDLFLTPLALAYARGHFRHAG